MKEIQVLPTHFPLPQKAQSILTGDECVIYGHPCKKLDTLLPIQDEHGNSIKGKIFLWVEEGKTNDFVEMISMLGLIPEYPSKS